MEEEKKITYEEKHRSSRAITSFALGVTAFILFTPAYFLSRFFYIGIFGYGLLIASLVLGAVALGISISVKEVDRPYANFKTLGKVFGLIALIFAAVTITIDIVVALLFFVIFVVTFVLSILIGIFIAIIIVFILVFTWIATLSAASYVALL